MIDEPPGRIRRIVIAGGGTAGWMTAAALCRLLQQQVQQQVQVTLVESDEIGSIGVGEATIPMIQRFNTMLGLDENEFLRETQGTFKLGIEFVGWGRPGERYMHGFGQIGQELGSVPFHQYWRRLHRAGRAGDLADYSIARAAARRNRFMRPTREAGHSPLAEITYAFHFDATLYAQYLRRYCEARGVQRVEGRIADATLGGLSGHVQALLMADGRHVEGELFIDCTGFRALLIEQVLKTGFEDWTHWLPCDRAVAVPCTSAPELLPYTRSSAHGAGWQWRIPLQHRIGNGHVYSSRHTSDDEATAVLLRHLDGAPLAEPRLLRFATGMRRLAWQRNVVAVGLSAGFMEPLESTSIHLIQSAIARLIDFFPTPEFNADDIDEFNRQSRFEFERIRDFLILHYHLNQRDDTAFWRDCAAMPIPPSLQQKLALYRQHGRLVRRDNELFTEAAWLQVMHGQNLPCNDYHPLADLIDADETAAYLQGLQQTIASCVAVMPAHDAFVQQHCRAA